MLDDDTIVDEFDPNIRETGIDVSNAAPPGMQGEPVARNNMVVRVSDLAIATIMILSNEQVEAVFPRFEAHPQLGFFIHSLACPAELVQERQQRIEQWKKRHSPAQAAS